MTTHNDLKTTDILKLTEKEFRKLVYDLLIKLGSDIGDLDKLTTDLTNIVTNIDSKVESLNSIH